MDKLFRLSGMKLFVAVVDVAAIMISSLFVFKYVFPHAESTVDLLYAFIQRMPWLGLLVLINFWLFDLYNLSGRRSFAKNMYNVAVCHGMITLQIVLIDYFVHFITWSRLEVLCALCMQLITMFLLRSLLMYVQFLGTGRKRTMIIAEHSDTARSIIERMVLRRRHWFEVHGVMLATEWNKEELEAMIGEVDLLLLSDDLTPEIKTDVLRLAGNRKLEVLIVPEFYELFLVGSEMQLIDDLLVYSIIPSELSLHERILKRSLDWILSSVLLLLLSPIMLALLVLIPLTSKGSALFKQERLGLNGVPFMVLKFRTMVDNAEVNTGPVLAADRDHRITKLGGLLRSTRLDELPQLINVIKGDMSLVGPRPEREYFINQFQQQIPHYIYRMSVKPGLTGLAQVKGKYTTSSSDKLRYDLMYIKNYSFLLDLKIIVQTILVVLEREQSKGVASNALAGQSGQLADLVMLTRQETAAAKLDEGRGGGYSLVSGEPGHK